MDVDRQTLIVVDVELARPPAGGLRAAGATVIEIKLRLTEAAHDLLRRVVGRDEEDASRALLEGDGTEAIEHEGVTLGGEHHGVPTQGDYVGLPGSDRAWANGRVAQEDA